MIDRVTAGNLQVAKELYDLVENDIAPGVGVDTKAFWQSFEEIVAELGPLNKKLLEKREAIQVKIDQYHREHQGQHDAEGYKAFLKEIGYLIEEGEDFSIETSEVDEEIATLAGPQLVVPVNNARYALNAANARWGSLFDAVYGSDIIDDEGGSGKTSNYNPARGQKVVDLAMELLDKAIPLAVGSHGDVSQYVLLDSTDGKSLQVHLTNGKETTLANALQFVGHNCPDEPTCLLFLNNGLHIQVLIDATSMVGKQHPAGIKDVVMESALTTIQDCEDSVAAVDAEDKVGVYKNWLGLMRGDLSVDFSKGGSTVSRTLNEDLSFIGVDGNELVLPGRSLLLVRNVGHLMTNNAVLDGNGQEVPEGMLDGMVTGLISLFDLKAKGRFRNSRKGNMYIVKPKMHGPEEVAFANTLFDRIEKALGMQKNTMKIGVMDEERRTTVNLKECIRTVRSRLIFINTGFLDRTGDEIHTSMEAGPMLPKAQIKQQPWIGAYEDWNVDNGLMCGLHGKAQIGKGMWAMPDLMKGMLDSKIAHPQAGANTAWVPSPTAATIHATHYHLVNVSERQEELMSRDRANLDDILTIPLMADPAMLSKQDIENELNNNAQGILGYVVRWIDNGVGCSKVPDIDNVGLMEDRATLRISSQHMANWLHHGICTEEQVLYAFNNMAVVVDKQNSDDPLYKPLAPECNGIAFKAALDLVLKGREQPSGYTEPLLHQHRIDYKAMNKESS